MLNVQNMAVIGATGICTNTRQSSHMIAYVHRAEGSANTCNDLRPGWGQTLLLSCRKRITFVMSALLFSALNICTVMSCFMCLKVVDAGQQQLSLLGTAYKILKRDVLASAAAVALRRAVWVRQRQQRCSSGTWERCQATTIFFLKHFSWVKFTGQSFLKTTGQFNKKKIKPNLYRNLCDKKNKCKKREECGH